MSKKNTNTVVKVKENNEVILNAAISGKTYKDVENFDDIKDSTLRSNLKRYIKNETAGIKSVWEMVRAIAEMSEHTKKDFSSDYDFAQFMGLSQSTVNKHKRLAKYSVDLEEMGFTATQAAEMLVIIGEAEKIADNNYDDEKERAGGYSRIIEDIGLIFSPSQTQKDIRTTAKNLQAAWNMDKKYVEIIPKTLPDKSADSESPESDNLENYSDESPKNNEEDTYIEYTLPWLEGNDLVDTTVQVSEDIAKELAKAIMQIIDINK